ncbi:MAG TPA: hypothetical protein VL172_08470 [Kofleriaceae bacterium]|nr:hypothetical protein [Kofleriaceae bacterium]
MLPPLDASNAGEDITAAGALVAGDQLLVSYSVRTGNGFSVQLAALIDGSWVWRGALPVRPGYFRPNGADPPRLAAAADGSLVAAWVESTSPHGVGEDSMIWLARSADGGRGWHRFGPLHRGGGGAEHSFPSLVPVAGDELRAVWLDGREADRGGSTQLRSARVIGHDVVDEEVVDPRVCDCCTTGMAVTADGPLVVYRDRSAAEQRDIAAVHRAGDRWLDPAPVATDGWIIEGCPVNGPAVAAEGRRVAVAWFTAAGARPRVRAALSDDGGAHFGPAVDVDLLEQPPGQFGWVGVVLDDRGGAVVGWPRPLPHARMDLMLRRIAADGSTGNALVVASLGPTFDMGKPRLLRRGADAVLLWTTPEPAQHLAGALVRLDGVP